MRTKPISVSPAELKALSRRIDTLQLELIRAQRAADVRAQLAFRAGMLRGLAVALRLIDAEQDKKK